MKKQMLILGFLAFNTSIIDAQILQGEISQQAKHGDWSSYIVRRGEDLRFRAATFNGGAVFMFDAIPPDCSVYVSFNLKFDRPSDSDIPATPIEVNARIDQGDVVPLDAKTAPIAMGDESYMLYLTAFNDFDKVMNILSRGSILRIKENVAGTPYYYSFSLDGIKTAFDRAYQGCVSYTHSQAPVAPPILPPPKTAPSVL